MLPLLLLALTAAQWQTDISYLETELPKRHPNLFFRLPQSQWTAALDDLKAHAADLTDVEAVILMQQVVARAGDGHTEVDTRRSPQTFYQLRLYRFSDGIFVTKTTDATRAACGARLVAIDGLDAEEVYRRAASVISHENDSWVAARFATPMLRAETLTALGVTASVEHARFTFEKGGVPFDLELTPVNGFLAPYAIDASWPLYMQNATRNYWYAFDAERHLMYVKYNVCTNDASRPFDAFAKEIFAIADRERVDRFVVDVRNNTGGNSSVAQPLIDGLAQRTSLRGRLFVIIGRETFSSGMLNAIELHNRAGAILAGEPSGGAPNGYGEVKSFALPSSGTTVFHSTKYFQNSSGDPDTLMPDMPVAVESSDFFSRRDPVLEAISPSIRPAEAGSHARRRAVTFSRTCP